MKYLTGLILLTFFVAGSANAVPTSHCVNGAGGDATKVIDLMDGCISAMGDGVYSNAGGGDPEAKVEEAIFHATNLLVDIALYGKSDEDPGLFSFTPGDPSTAMSGVWSVLDGTLISYISVKAANAFALYQLPIPSASGVFDTIGILNNGGNQPNVSHISFWTADKAPDNPIPEPASAMLLLGGMLGASRLKRSK